MRKIKYLFLSLLLIPLLTGCSFFDFFNDDTEESKSIEIAYVIDGKKQYKTYDSYDTVTFLDYTTETGYKFDGWSLTIDGSIVSKNDLKGKKSVTLYPITSLINYKITYNLDGGTNNSNNPSFYTIEDEYTISAPTKDGYAFSGWTTDTITTPISAYKIEAGSYGDLELTANYVIGKVNVIFYGYEDLNQVIDYNTVCSKPANPTKLGDTFDYWATDDSLETEFDFTTLITESITLYPKWKSTSFYTLTIDNYELINSNYPSGKKLPENAVIELSTDYILENKEFIGWYIDDELVSKNYKLSVKMPKSNLTITPMFNDITTYEYFIGSNTNLQTNVYMESDGKLFGCNIENNYGHISNRLFISYYALDKLKPGLNSFVYESRLIINVFIKVKDKAVTNINVDYDINYPKTTLTFNEVEGYNYSYSLDNSSYVSCHSGDTFTISNKLASHTLFVKCEDGEPVEYVMESIPVDASTYLSNTFTYQGDTYDHYVESYDDLKTIIEYYAVSKYPSVGGTSYTFNFYNGYISDFKEQCKRIVKRELSIPYGLAYQYTVSGNLVAFTLLSSGAFNIKATSQERNDLTTTVFLPSTRSESYNDFYIEKCTKTQEVRSIYELECLNVGVKPIITDEKVLLLYNKAKEILRTYVDDYMSDFEKIKAIYDYLGTYVTYDDALLEITTDESDYQSFTAYSALINGIAVCDGISSAFKLLCTMEGIECIEVIGCAATGGHAWNKVKLGNVWYGVDATWTKFTILNVGVFVYHSYFMINEAELLTYGNKHYEQGDAIAYDVITNHNVVNTANNSLTYYDLMMYGDYDLVCSSKLEYKAMHDYFKSLNLDFVEIYLDGITLNDIKNLIPFSPYSLSQSSLNPNVVYMIR